MSTRTSGDRVSIKDALPRLYADIEERLGCHRPHLLEQLRSLYLVERCRCGLDGCVSFTCESNDARFVPVNSRRPLSYPLKAIHGWYSVSDDGVLTGFEILNDYADGYVNSRLIEAGLGFNTPFAKVTNEELSEEAGDASEGLSRPFAEDPGAEGQKGPTRSVYMTTAATQHLIEYRLGVQAYSPEDIVDFTESAMSPSASPEATVVANVQYPSLVSMAMLERKARLFKVRMPLHQIGSGFEVRSIVPEGISQAPATL